MSKLLEVLRSRVVQNGAAEMKDMIYDLWSLPVAAVAAKMTEDEARKEAESSPDIELFTLPRGATVICSRKRRP